jgi:serine/threonine protein kinase
MIQLDHPNIVKHYEWFKEENIFDHESKKLTVKYSVLMEFADDGDLSQKIDSSKISKEVNYDWLIFPGNS